MPNTISFPNFMSFLEACCGGRQAAEELLDSLHRLFSEQYQNHEQQHLERRASTEEECPALQPA